MPDWGTHGQRDGILRHREDRRSLFFLGVTLLLLVTPLLTDIVGWPAVVWVATTTLFCFNACIINHNHIHLPIFHARGLNVLLGHVLTIAKGHTSGGVIIAHNYNHHRHQGGEHDWIRPQLAAGGAGARRLLRYIAASSLSMARGRNAVGSPRLAPPQARQVRNQRLSLVAFCIIAVWLGAERSIWFIGLPWLLGMAMLVGVNLLQHDGCVSHSRYGHSRNFTGRLGNWFFLNNGYHTAHHLRPSMHWSRLPEYHRKSVRPHLRAALERRSIVFFLFATYILRLKSGPA